MVKRIVKSEISIVYDKLKGFLTENNFKIIAEEAPKKVSVVQGSLWGTSSKTAQKKISYTLMQDTEGTHIASASELTARYINLTLAGSIFSVLLLVICSWIALNLQAYTSTGVQDTWGWLAQSRGHFDADKAAVFIRLMRTSAAFLIAILVLEAGVLWNVRRKIDFTAEDTLRAIAQ